MTRPRGGETAKATRRIPVPGSEAAQPSDRADASKRAAAPGLHLVATPIGHAADITLRALDVLRDADLVACEDTRVSAKLFALHGITTARVAYHEHNGERMRPRLLALLQAGRAIALVSDAGTPLVSDPGYKLVQAVLEAGLPVHVEPGASAPLAALLLSGLPSDRFLFAGFLDSRQAARRRDLESLAAVPATLVFFEAAPRLAASLADMAAVLGDRPAAVARELTKRFEEVVRAPLVTLARRYAESGPPKGEIVVVVGGPLAVVTTEDELDRRLRLALDGASLRDAAAAVAAALGLPRRTVYARALALAGEAE